MLINVLFRMISQVIKKKTMSDVKAARFKKETDGTFTPCRDNSVERMKFTDLPPNKLRGNPLTFEDFKNRFDNPIRACQSNQNVEITTFKAKYPDELKKKSLPEQANKSE